MQRNEQMWTPQEITQKPWGHEKIIRKTDSYVVKELYLKPHSRLSLQYHKKKIETMFLVEGKGWLETKQYCLVQGGDVTVELLLVPLFPHLIPPGTEHRLFTEDSSCLVVEVSSTELDDVVRIEDDYGRTG